MTHLSDGIIDSKYISLDITMYNLIIVLIQFVYLHQISAQSELKETSDCTCLGYTKTFECVVIGSPIGTTVWQGTAFNCEVDTVINLLHSQFASASGAFGSCNNGAIAARNLRIENNQYISQLNVTVDGNMIGETIECAYDDGGTTNIIGTNVITATSDHLPVVDHESVSWQFVNSLHNLNIYWSPVLLNCPAIDYSIFSSYCGKCPTTTTQTSVTCTDVAVPIDDGIRNHSKCTFSAQAVVCGNIVGNVSNIVIIALQIYNGVVLSENCSKFQGVKIEEKGYIGATIATSLLSVLLLVIISILFVMIVKVKTRPSQHKCNMSSVVQPPLIITTQENIAYDHIGGHNIAA